MTDTPPTEYSPTYVHNPDTPSVDTLLHTGLDSGNFRYWVLTKMEWRSKSNTNIATGLILNGLLIYAVHILSVLHQTHSDCKRNCQSSTLLVNLNLLCRWT